MAPHGEVLEALRKTLEIKDRVAAHVAKEDSYAHHIRAHKLETGHLMAQEVWGEVELHMQRANIEGLRKALDCKERLAAHRVPPPPVEEVWQEQLEEVVRVVESLKCACTCGAAQR